MKRLPKNVIKYDTDRSSNVTYILVFTTVFDYSDTVYSPCLTATSYYQLQNLLLILFSLHYTTETVV